MSSAVAATGVWRLEAPVERRAARLRRPLPADRLWAWGVPLLITAIAFALRLYGIGKPKTRIFDEVYYSKDAWSMLHHGVEVNGNAPAFVAHPPLGKWMIAVGEAMFGNTPLGWRFSSAVVGSLSILMIARIARRMFRSNLLGCVAAVLLSLDGLEFVQSRTSMLDIFLMFWVLAGFGCLVLDRDDGRRRVAARLEAGRSIGFLGVRPWRFAAGACVGAAAAVKWNGIFFAVAFVLLAIWWDAGARRVAAESQPGRSAVVRDGLFALVPFLLLPVVVYTLSWTGWFLSDAQHAYDHDKYVHGQGTFGHVWAVLRGWWAYHHEMWNFHTGLAATHPYLSNPLGWPLLARPVAYYYESPKNCGAAECSAEVLGIGTPAIWWLSIPALVAAAWRMLGKFDWRGAAIVVCFLTGWLVWVFDETRTAHGCHDVASNCHRTMFLFYLLPDVPFMVLALTMAIGMLLASGRVRRIGTALSARAVIAAVAVAVYVVGVGWNFAYFYPVLTGQTITKQQWSDRMWFDICDTNLKRNQHHENAPCWI